MIWIGGLIRKGKGMNEKGKWMKYEGGTTKKVEMNEWEREMNNMRRGD